MYNSSCVTITLTVYHVIIRILTRFAWMTWYKSLYFRLFLELPNWLYSLYIGAVGWMDFWPSKEKQKYELYVQWNDLQDCKSAESGFALIFELLHESFLLYFPSFHCLTTSFLYASQGRILHRCILIQGLRIQNYSNM